MVRRSRAILAALSLLWSCGPAAAGQTVGLLSMVSGSVQIHRAGSRAPVPARTADLIGAGDRVITSHNSSATFLFCPASSAGTITAQSEVQFETAGIQVRKGKLSGERKVASCRLPSALGLTEASQQTSGIARFRNGHKLVLRTPIRSRLASQRPWFRWDAVKDATAYDVTLMDREERVLWRKGLNATEVEYPADAPALQWGQNYRWRVSARSGGEVFIEAGSHFELMPREQAERVRASQTELLRIIKDNPADDGPRFLLAFLYEENGMLDEAARLYEELTDRMGPQPWVQSRLAEISTKLGWEDVVRNVP